MAKYETVMLRNGGDGRKVWTSDAVGSEEHPLQGLYVLTTDGLYAAVYNDARAHAKALAKVRDGRDPEDAIGTSAIAVPLEEVVRVEKAPENPTLYVQYRDEGRTRWAKVRCPDGLAGVLFQTLEERLSPPLRYARERVTTLMALASPIGVLIVTWIITGLIYAGASIAARQPDGPNEPEFRTNWQQGAIMIGGLLGTTGVLILGTLATVGVLGWTGFVVARRPMKKVLRQGPPGGKRRTAADRAADEADEPRGSRRRAKASAGRGWILGLWLGLGGLALLGLAVGVVIVVLIVGRRPLPAGPDPAPVPPGPGPAPPAMVEQKTPPKVVAGWGTVIDPDADCTITPQGATLAMNVPGTPHDLSAEQGQVNAPRVLQEVDGDFTAVVRVSGLAGPTAAGTVPGRAAYQGAGLLLWSDARNYVRLERATLNRGAVQTNIAMEVRTNGTMTEAKQSPPVVVADNYLRMIRRGNELIGAASVDGKKWQRIGLLTVPLPQKLQVGVTAVNAAQQPLAVRFEDFRLLPKAAPVP